MKELRQEYWSTVTLKEKWETAISGRRTDSVQEEIPVVFTTDQILSKSTIILFYFEIADTD